MKEKHEIYLFGHPIKEYLPILFFFSIVWAIDIVLSAIPKANFWVVGATIYLLIAFFLYYYSTSQDIESKDYEITKLKQEIKKLEDIRGSNEFIIELLEKELDKHTIAHTTSNNKKE